MNFPTRCYESMGSFYDEYAECCSRAQASVDRSLLCRAAELLQAAISRDSSILACGNGGSAAISNHLACDHAKGISADTGLKPLVRSLVSTIELITAVANDISYADVFGYQVKMFGRAGDVLITISSSGDSENIVRALHAAKEVGLSTIALTGFSGGRSARLADINLHVAAENYGVVEDVHQSIMHGLAQYIRHVHMPQALIGERRF